MAGCLLLTALAVPVAAADLEDYPVSNGHYYTQGGPGDGGFTVVNDEAAPLWREFRRLGGVSVVGYPISRRYACDGATCQALQKAVFKWSPGAKQVELLSVFDILHRQDRDAWLEEEWGVPPWTPVLEGSEEARKAQEEHESAEHLQQNPTLRAAYERPGMTAAQVYGLARAYRETATGAALRTQRTVLIQAPDAPDNVKLLPAGEVFREAGLVPVEARAPIDVPAATLLLVPTNIKVPDLGIDAEVITLTMGEDRILPIPDNGRVVAWYSYGARLGEAGNAVLAGHVDWNRERGVFWRLREAQPGQTITLSAGTGPQYDYVVEWVREYPEDSPEGLTTLWPETDETTITLVTCSGRFDAATRTYESRKVVRAKLVGNRT